jgi:hypothetical protein
MSTCFVARQPYTVELKKRLIWCLEAFSLFGATEMNNKEDVCHILSFLEAKFNDN